MVYMGPQLNGDEEKGDYIYFFHKIQKKKKKKKKWERTETKDDCFGHGWWLLVLVAKANIEFKGTVRVRVG